MNPLLSPSEQAHIAALRSNGAAQFAHPTLPTPQTPYERLAQWMNNITYQDVFKWTTNVLALAITAFYIAALVHDYNPRNPLASTTALVHVTASLGICLAMSATPALSGMRFFQIAALLLLANLG